MEMNVDNYICIGVLEKEPLYPRQQPYSVSRSTETAIYELIKNIRYALDNNETALCTFLEPSKAGAFDNTSRGSIQQTLEGRQRCCPTE